MPARMIEIQGVEIHLAEPMKLPPVASLDAAGFVGRKRDLCLCRAAWDIEEDEPALPGNGCRRSRLAQGRTSPLNFRLEGPPGIGKNELVYQLARELGMDLYVIQGHEELTPEDLALLIVPDHDGSGAADGDLAPRAARELPFVVRASPLATALLAGGLFFFDEINRVPERALSPLASVLDGRRMIFSALTGLWIGPQDERAAASFRFSCALNPQYGQDLPEYIAQRTLPRFEIKPAELDDLVAIVRANVEVPDAIIQRFRSWYKVEASRKPDGQPSVSARQAIQLLRFAWKLSSLAEFRDAEDKAFEEAVKAVFGSGGNGKDRAS